VSKANIVISNYINTLIIGRVLSKNAANRNHVIYQGAEPSTIRNKEAARSIFSIPQYCRNALAVG
jgi:hypothetical protein